MRNQTESLIGASHRLLSKVIESLSVICGRRYPRETETSIAHYHGARALGLLRAIQALLNAGLPREATVLSRSLLNLLIDFAWLASGYSTVRFQWFADCEVLTRRAQLDGLLSMGEISEEQHRLDIERLQPDWDEFCSKYGYTLMGKRPPSKWAQSIKDLAYDLKDRPTWGFLWRDYESSYRYLSADEHTDPRAALHYLDAQSERSELREVSADDYETLLVETCRYGIAVLLASNDALDAQHDVDSLNMELGELQDRLNHPG